MKKVSKGMVFGVFDGLHPGHQYFLTEAAKQCDRLIVVVTLDEMVQQFKNRLPKYSFAERVAKIKSFNPSFVITENDLVIGQWQVLKTHQPDMVFLGHDQEVITREMARLGVPTTVLPAHYPDKYKSSLLNK